MEVLIQPTTTYKHLPPPHATAGRFGEPQVGLSPHAIAQDFDLECHEYCIEDQAHMTILHQHPPLKAWETDLRDPPNYGKT